MSVPQTPPGPIRYQAVRLVLKAVMSAYVRMNVVNAEGIPERGPYIICEGNTAQKQSPKRHRKEEAPDMNQPAYAH